MDHRTGFEQCIFRKVKTVSVRHEATIHDPAQIACVAKAGHKKSAAPTEPESAMDMFEIGFQALKTVNDPKTKTLKASLSEKTLAERDERCSKYIFLISEMKDLKQTSRREAVPWSITYISNR